MAARHSRGPCPLLGWVQSPSVGVGHTCQHCWPPMASQCPLACGALRGDPPTVTLPPSELGPVNGVLLGALPGSLLAGKRAACRLQWSSRPFCPKTTRNPVTFLACGYHLSIAPWADTSFLLVLCSAVHFNGTAINSLKIIEALMAFSRGPSHPSNFTWGRVAAGASGFANGLQRISSVRRPYVWLWPWGFIVSVNISPSWRKRAAVRSSRRAFP